MFIRINELSPTAHSATQLGTTLLGTRASFLTLTDISDYSHSNRANLKKEETMMSNLSQVATQSHATSEPRKGHTLGAREQISPTGGPEQDPLQVQLTVTF